MNARNSITLNFAGIQLEVHSEESRMQLVTSGPVSKFTTAKGTSDCRITVKLADLSIPQDRGEQLLDSGGVWQIYTRAEDFLFVLSSPQVAPHPYKTLLFNSNFSEGTLFLHEPLFLGTPSIYPLEYPLDELVTIALLGIERGIEVHGCGVVDEDGAGYLFTGHSGAGKTTIARYWQNVPGSRILSDDRIILRNVGGRVQMFGTPWHGEAELSEQHSAPLSALFFLQQARENILAPLKVAQSVAMLVARTFPPFYSRAGMQFTVQFCQQVVQRVFVAELRFLPQAEVLRIIRHGSYREKSGLPV